ncbi:MAG: HD-GYP domain-containing protein [Spirochaetes bacterium]|nr:HD-GYP domain-containing protein [Spirochaetota bacterium]
MNKIKASDLTPNQIYESNLYLSSGSLFLGKHIPVEAEDISRLIKWQIDEVYTHDDKSVVDSKDLSKSFERFVKDRVTFAGIYDRCIATVREHFMNFQTNNIMSLGRMKEVVNELYSMVTKNPNILLNVLNAKEVTQENNFFIRSVDVAALSLMIGVSVGLPEERLRTLGIGALLYDIGMLKMNSALFKKVGKFTAEEFQQMKMHTIFGFKLLVQVFRLDPEVGLIAAEHHEQVDGKGYPRGLKGEKISQFAKIVAIAQAFEGITKNENRPDTKKSLYEAMKIILQEAPTRYDTDMVKVFLSTMSLYPVGSLVILNDGRKAIVFIPNPGVPMRPIIKIIFDENDNYLQAGPIINLVEEKSVFIKGSETNTVLLVKAANEVYTLTHE